MAGPRCGRTQREQNPGVRSQEPVKDFGRAVSRILSSRSRKHDRGENHLSQQPVPGTCSAVRNEGAGHSVVPYLALHPMGFSVPPRLRSERWALTPPFHPYLDSCKHEPRRYIFCGTFRQDASRRHCPRVSQSQPAFVGCCKLRGIAPCGVRTFLPSGLLRRSDSPPFQNQR